MSTSANWRGFLQSIRYPVQEGALEKWAADNLSIESTEGTLVCRFTLQGSTCRSGGNSFAILVRADFTPRRGRLVISDGEIRVPASESDVLGAMCAFRGNKAGHGRSHGEGPVRFELPPVLAGKPLEGGIASLKETNPAGCLCTEANRNHKWLWFLSTVHYALFSGSDLTV